MPEIGLMGGSFNPIHRGHVALARAALDSGKVERVLFLPTGNPPHKREGLADKFDRLRMVELAVAHEAGMAVCREEIDRGGVIYTVDTLAALQSKMPDCSLTYLIGADTLRALGTWRRVETVIERCKFLVMLREGETREDVIRLAGLWASRGARRAGRLRRARPGGARRDPLAHDRAREHDEAGKDRLSGGHDRAEPKALSGAGGAQKALHDRFGRGDAHGAADEP